MAVATVRVTEGTGPLLDFRTVGASTDRYRQAVVIGDPTTDTEVAPVTALYGLGVDVKRLTGNVTVVGTGTFAVQDATAQASLSVLDDWDESDRAKVNPIVGQAGVQSSSGVVTATTQRMVLATDVGLPAGTSLLGKIAAVLSTDTIYNGTTALTPKFATIAASTSGNNQIVAAVTSKKIRVLAAQLISNGTVNAKWQSGSSGTDLTGLAYLVANAGYVLPFNPCGWFESASGVLLNLNLSAAINVGGSILYIEV
jgi:hypothetical protein